MRGYILDFYCPKALLAVEVDGGAHRLTPATDAKRDEVLKSIGIETLRVSNENVIHDMKSVLQTIRRRVDKRKDIALRLKLLDHEWNLFRYGLPEVEPEPATVTKRPSRTKKFQWYCYECPGYFAGMSKSAAKCPKNNRHRATRVCSICKNQPLDGGDLNCARCSDARDAAISSAGFGAQGPDGVQLRSATRGKRVR